MRSLIFVLMSVVGGAGVVLSYSKFEPVIAPVSASQLYTKNCTSCHGRDGRARTIKARINHARNLTDAEWQSRVSDERIFNSIVNGKGKMPSFGKKLSDQEIDSLVTYVRSLKK